ncbi:hypothetical protein CHLNCDRAFT_22742 [Chlorella variabilis]|uniref:Uncharacterized protein n=1 Tax=Chlorella variabilis TaxID=554065 RepID=E1ZDR8_CHLVA|nr:hypothetical protein CHLNCDRAFT_22742 [Chlorella variabilis]EFN55906.1 hypothetical protein CHLNCDRAFT_22742 [Chlorella variabilis]|eukprot:XP_005848008.1 hypothetical protein CHLNCDRAFT_22742 [Chlorella variabilis]
MVRPKARGGRQQSNAAGRKRKQRDEFFDEEDEADFFVQSGEEGAGSESEDEESEQEETAEEKRLRLAKAYLDQVKAIEAAEREPGSESEDEEGGDGGGSAAHDAVAGRLRDDALEGMGHLQRRLAHRLALPPLPRVADYGGAAACGGRLLRGHRLSVTAVALTADERTVFSVSKDGAILEHDVESGARQRFVASSAAGLGRVEQTGTEADWVKRGPRQSGAASLLAAAVSGDGRYLAVGGGDRKVHVWDARSRQYVRGFPGHKDAVTCLAFREGTHELYSGSLDRSIKLWSLDDMAYVDTLFGHQAEVLSVDALRAERCVSCGADRTCRVWKIPEESQLIFRGHCLTIECCRYIAGGAWATGAADGSLSLWSGTKKKPMFTMRRDGEEAEGAGSVGGDAATWVGSVGVCRGSDLLASGAGDGVVRLWRVADAKGGSSKALEAVGGVPVRGFVNSLALGRSGRVLVAGVGQEPRMGRWLRDAAARNGVLIQPLQLDPEGGD